MKFLSAVAGLLLLVSCKKVDVDADGLVPATQAGKNTGDFLFNGAPFGPLPRVSSPGTKPVGAFWGRSGRRRRLQLSFFREERDARGTVRLLNLFIANPQQPGTYSLVEPVSPFVVSGAQSYASYSIPGIFPQPYAYYLTGPTAVGRVELTRYDTVARVVSGTFEAKLREYNGPDSAAITKGRFDCTF